MSITPLPTPPQRSDGPDAFANNGDVFIAALPAFVSEANALAAQVSADSASVAIAAPGAVAAANFKGEYSAATTYQVGHSTSYGGDTWFAKTINTGVTPVVGAAWQKVQAIPSQAGNSGKFLSTDGSSASWQTPSVVPSQAGNSGKVLTTDGTVASWVDAKASAETLTNKTLSAATNNIESRSLKSATSTVVVSAAAAPSAGQVLTASSSTAAEWSTPAQAIAYVAPGTSGNLLVSSGSAWASQALALPEFEAVGSYVFARFSVGSGASPGDVAAGSSLKPAGFNSVGTVVDTGVTLTGSWRFMGSAAFSVNGYTLFMRIS